MIDQSSIKHFFSKITTICNSVSILLSIWLISHLFIRSIGGPFPQRTMGPFPKKEFYQLGILPDWENLLVPRTEGGNKTFSEMLNDGEKLPELPFAYPPEASAPPVEASAPTAEASSVPPEVSSAGQNAASPEASAASASGN
ncbi:MAG: hypothetical protein AB1656_14770 [Candidatus Omnitrophota bacterium]